MSSNHYPLTWPPGWPRTDQMRRERSRFNTTISASLNFLKEEIRRLGAKDLVLSSNYTLGTTSPKDPGVCAYFQYQGISAAIPCDRWLNVEDNVHAIAKTIEAMRGIERWGAKNMIKAAFSGFAALPGPGQTSAGWREILGLNGETTGQEIESAYRRLRSLHHPDKGGSAELFHAVQIAYDQAKQAVGS